MKYLLCVIFLFNCLLVSSQSSVWLIEGKEFKMYVGGSIHILREQDYPLPEEFEEAYNNSEVLVLEVDLNPNKSLDYLSTMIGLTLYPSNKSLKTELRKDVYEKLDSAFIANGLILENLIGYKPVMAILTLGIVELHKIGVNTKGVDKYFFEKAIESERSLLSLESVDYQIDVLAKLGEDNENEFVLYSLEESNQYREFESVIENWSKGNNTNLLEWINSWKNDYPESYNSLLVERNNNWISNFEDYLKTPQVEFVIVGAAHLYGQDGVLQLMKDRGYKVQPLKL